MVRSDGRAEELIAAVEPLVATEGDKNDRADFYAA
jgi:hypothetical protein